MIEKIADDLIGQMTEARLIDKEMEADIYLYKDGTRFQRNEYEILCYFFFRRIGYEH